MLNSWPNNMYITFWVIKLFEHEKRLKVHVTLKLIDTIVPVSA